MPGESEQPVIQIRLQREPDMNADPAGRRRVPARRSCGPSSAAQPTQLRALVRNGTPVGGRLQAVERTVPFGLIGFSVVTLWYPVHGMRELAADIAASRPVELP
jgi:hypothetical protein